MRSFKRYMESESDWISTLILCALAIICLSFLSGTDDGMDRQDAAHRLAVYCQDAPLSMLCMGEKHE